MLRVFVIFSCLYFTNALELLQCDAGGPLAVNVELTGCTDYPCPLYRGEDAEIRVTFDVPSDMETAAAAVRASVGGLEVNYPLPDPDVCHFLQGGFCPLEEGERVTYQLKMPILKIYPTVKFIVELTLLTPEKEVISCTRIPGQIMDR